MVVVGGGWWWLVAEATVAAGAATRRRVLKLTAFTASQIPGTRLPNTQTWWMYISESLPVPHFSMQK